MGDPVSSALAFFVPGIPRPQGSKRGFITKPKDPKKKPRAVVVEDSKDVKPWRSDVKAFASEAMVKARFGGWFRKEPVVLELSFYFQRPKTSKNAHPVVKPDLDKLERAVCDALKGTLYGDDCQVVAVSKRKFYASVPGLSLSCSCIEIPACSGGPRR